MSLQIALGTNLIIGATAPIVLKLVAGRLPKAQALSLQFLICAVLIWLFGLATGNFQPSSEMIIIATVGFVNAFGAFCQWQAIDLSMSKTYLLAPLAQILTVFLASTFLNEVAKWNIPLIMGITLSFLGVFVFVISRAGIKKENKNNNIKKWLFFVSAMIIIFGTASFLMKVFSFSVPRTSFLISWYTGAFLGSLSILYSSKQNFFKYPGKTIFLVPLASLAILSYLATEYWAFELALASQVAPFQAVAGTFAPLLSGWFIFKERKGLSKKEMLAFATGIVGALLIILA